MRTRQMSNLVGKCRLRKLLEQKDMSQSTLARKLNTTPQQVQHYVQNTRMMSLTTAKRIALILDCLIDDLYEWEINGNDIE